MIGTLLDRRYRVVQVLATGGFGQTYIAEDTKRPGNPICVVKHLKPASSDAKLFETAKRLFQSEAESLEKLGNHDQIPRLLAYFDENQEFYLVQEFIQGHTLSEELVVGQCWSEAQVFYLLHEILSILDFVHAQGVIHRDIKPDNIIRRTTDNKLVLVDFGAVKQLRVPGGYPARVNMGGQSTATVAIGTPGYMPTEQGQGKPRPNSDIYALGMIAIQALTGVSPMDLQEDPNTGEFIWQHLVPISPQLAEVLRKMVRYHFKDRYQNAGEALRALNAIAPQAFLASSGSVTTPTGAMVRVNSPYSRQQTLAVAPKHRQPVASAVVATPTPIKREQTKFDFLQLFVLLLLIGGTAAVTPMLVQNFQALTANWTKNDPLSSQACMAEIGGTANIRSEPSAINSQTILKTVNRGTKLEVTGTRTKKGWVQLRLDSGQTAWTHSSVIANNQEWGTCLRDRGVAIQVVNDDNLIADRPAPKPIASVRIPPQPAPQQTPNNQPTGINPVEVLEQARKKYESGDFQGAIDLLRSVPQGIEDTRKTISQWQKEWEKAEKVFRDIDEAIAQGNWDKVKELQKNPQGSPNIQYWRDKINPLLQKANERLSQQKTPENPIPQSEVSPPATKEREKSHSSPTPSPNPETEVNPAEELINNLFAN
ncbi:serine/threonine protein kinase [Calothrix sp. NIES-3974]|uniref:serine/threonine protein kinase n=1 Tax=Calothrix sp. NIES-3974 TaxID=2005462 RepID=UPI000B601790|nr:serine/threonine protein kinase [Calothrix sp. NIES-3974]BAZ07905.1 serine/threonine kinase [Calothrix sp. NIES-3974]